MCAYSDTKQYLNLSSYKKQLIPFDNCVIFLRIPSKEKYRIFLNRARNFKKNLRIILIVYEYDST